MNIPQPNVLKKMILVTILLSLFLSIAVVLGLSQGSSGTGIRDIFSLFSKNNQASATLSTIIWKIRLPRVILAALVGAALSLGGLVFQALLRNPLAEPYILGISGGAAIGAITGILLGLSQFPGVSMMAFAGSMATLVLVMVISGGKTLLQQDSLLLSGVMVNAFCSAMILFLVSMTQDSRIHNIIFWLMGDFSIAGMPEVSILAFTLVPCFVLVFCLSHSMNILLMGREMAATMGVNVKLVVCVLLIVTSFMVSSAVSTCGLIGFVGLVIPHLLRLLFGADHRVLVPASIIGGGAYMVFCDLLARVLPRQGEMPAGVITAMIGAPLFIILLKRANK